MVVNFEKKENALVPIVVTVEGILILVNDAHLENVSFPIVVLQSFIAFLRIYTSIHKNSKFNSKVHNMIWSLLGQY